MIRGEETIMQKKVLDWDRYKQLARQAAAEGCVLLKNDHHALPLRNGDKVAVFGRMAFHYYKSGLGSGGLVNTHYVTGILDALKEETSLELNEQVLEVYEKWISENPYDTGNGWGQIPWSQKEMPLEESVITLAEDANAALVIIGRTAGEDQDFKEEAGSYFLTDIEKDMISKVSRTFERTIVVLNVGNIIDMSWVEEYDPAAVLYVWQGGQEGGNGVVDILTGKVNPCGKLTDTIAKSLKDYPSTAYFGDLERNFYKEDIYVGYRYFETFAKEKVLYPFGYGLSYTTFSMKGKLTEQNDSELIFGVEVKNTGDVPGKQVVQIYVSAPQGKLGKPERALVAFAKTKELEAGETECITLHVPLYYLASYDDSGVTGKKSAYVMETGEYQFYIGEDVRHAEYADNCMVEHLIVVEQLEEACAPVRAFTRMKPNGSAGNYRVEMEDVPTRTIDWRERLYRDRMQDIPYTGNRWWKLSDVYEGKVGIEEFIAQFDDDDLIHMFRGEGMCSPRVTPGTASAFGGVTDKLGEFGIPAVCCSDGPSGIRMDCGTNAFSLPNGTALACSFNTELAEKLYRMLGLELRINEIDTLLGPGMNIHRNPLNGRNFEYFSEDPLVTGKMGSAQCRGMKSAGVVGTIKHFAGNNQEKGRHTVDSVISERALREIYLRGFEIAIKEKSTTSVMTTYGAVNGLWTAGSYDLCTTILRKEWGFDGIVMTDWWAKANEEDHAADVQNKASMVMAQNDLYMCVRDAKSNPENDNVKEKLASGFITRGDLQRNAKNILGFVLHSPAMQRKLGVDTAKEIEQKNMLEKDEASVSEMVYYRALEEDNSIRIEGKQFCTERGHAELFGITIPKDGTYEIEIRMKSQLGELAQIPVSVFLDNVLKHTITIQGTEGKTVVERRSLGAIASPNHYIKLLFGNSGLEIEEIVIK